MSCVPNKIGEKGLSIYQQICLAAFLFAMTSPSDAETAPLQFQSTLTPPIWSPNLPNNGIGGAILQLLSTATDLPYHIQYLPIKRFRQSSATYLLGDPDILKIQKNYTVLPIMLFHSALFFYLPHHQPIAIHSLKDLKGYTLGVLRGTVEDKSYFTHQGIRIEENDSIESLLKKLKKGRVDVCVLVEISGQHTIKTFFTQEQKNFVSVTIPNSERPVALIINTDLPEAKAIAIRYHSVLHQTLNSSQYLEIMEKHYGKNNLPKNWFEQLSKFESIYATDTLVEP